MKAKLIIAVLGIFIVTCAHAQTVRKKAVKAQKSTKRVVITDKEKLSRLLEEIDKMQAEEDATFLRASQITGELVPLYNLGERLKAGKRLSKAEMRFARQMLKKYTLLSKAKAVRRRPKAPQVCTIFTKQRKLLKRHSENAGRMIANYKEATKLLVKLKMPNTLISRSQLSNKEAEWRSTLSMVEILNAPCPFAS